MFKLQGELNLWIQHIQQFLLATKNIYIKLNK
jgi:hypothetical protein